MAKHPDVATNVVWGPREGIVRCFCFLRKLLMQWLYRFCKMRGAMGVRFLEQGLVQWLSDLWDSTCGALVVSFSLKTFGWPFLLRFGINGWCNGCRSLGVMGGALAV